MRSGKVSSHPSSTRRDFLKMSGVAAIAVTTLPLFHFRSDAFASAASTAAGTPKLGSWEDLYRERWTWDAIVKGSHGWANCRSLCGWDLYVKDGVVVREEQSASYEASEPGVPDFNPRGCQKGACYTEVMYGPSRLTVPMKRVGERGSGQWERITWDQAIDEIAEKMVDVAQEYGTDTIYQDLGPNFDHGATTVGRFKFQMKAGGMFADMWAEIGDLNIGATLALGMAHVGGSSDEWFLSDYLVVWMMNPSVTQMADAHFLFEAQHNGSELTVIDPQYSATAIHADNWIPIQTGTDAALGLAVARHIWESGNLEVDYVREQTDFPLLVRLDTGRFLRGKEMLLPEPRTGREKGERALRLEPRCRACGGSAGLRGSRQRQADRGGFCSAHRRALRSRPPRRDEGECHHGGEPPEGAARPVDLRGDGRGDGAFARADREVRRWLRERPSVR